MPDEKRIQRYDCESGPVDKHSRETAGMQRWPQGQWVRYSDHLEALGEEREKARLAGIDRDSLLEHCDDVDPRLEAAEGKLNEIRSRLDDAIDGERELREKALNDRDGKLIHGSALSALASFRTDLAALLGQPPEEPEPVEEGDQVTDNPEEGASS